MLAVLWIADGVPQCCKSTTKHSWDEARFLFIKEIASFGLDMKYPDKMPQLLEEMKDEFEFGGFEFSPTDSLWIIEVENEKDTRPL